jgi:hypothetical protein
VAAKARRAIDWLNDHVGEDVGFYAVRVELWQIDASSPAVRFNTLARPPISGKPMVQGAKPLSDVRKLQLEWWGQFREALLAKKAVPSVQAPRAQYWYNVALGRSGYHISNIADTSGNRIGVRVYMRANYGAALALQQLLQQKNEIEKELGYELQWDPNPETTDKIIAICRDVDLKLRGKWSEYLAWMIDRTVDFRRVFASRVKGLELAEGEDPEANECAESA